MSKEHDFKSQFNAAAPFYDRTFRPVSEPYAQHIIDILPDITSTSIIDDNAASPGVVASQVLARFPQGPRPRIEATDFSEALISALQDRIAKEGWQDCLRASVMDSQELAFEGETFTHSIMNMAVFIIPDADKAVSEIWRTLKPGGTAVLTSFKENGLVGLIQRAQTYIRPNSPKFSFYDQQWVKADKLKSTLEKAGFDAGKIRIEAKEVSTVGTGDWSSKPNLAKSSYRASLSRFELRHSPVLRLVYESAAIAIYGYVVVVLRVYVIPHGTPTIYCM
jgi:ubiquinone/menaquinone biosynthesis C-methylase UbiE